MYPSKKHMLPSTGGQVACRAAVITSSYNLCNINKNYIHASIPDFCPIQTFFGSVLGKCFALH